MRKYRSYRFSTFCESLEQRLSLSGISALITPPAVVVKPTLPGRVVVDDPVPDPEPDPGDLPTDEPPILVPPIPPSGPVGPGFHLR
jgi:hypothetical protein